MVIDVVTYNGEKDLFDLRYNVLKDYVDRFIVVEFDKTFSGGDRKGSFLEIAEDYPKAGCYFFAEDFYEKYRSLAEASPNTKGASHWITEFMQKETIKDALIDLIDDDVVYIGDCDEIYEPNIDIGFEKPNKLKLKVYTYWLNNRSSEQFWGTIVGRYIDIKDTCLNDLRNNSPKTIDDFGWHFTSMAGQLKQKLFDSYTEESYNNKWVQDHLKQNIKENRDFLGRNFTYKTDESEWPQFLKDNKNKYKHLLK